MVKTKELNNKSEDQIEKLRDKKKMRKKQKALKVKELKLKEKKELLKGESKKEVFNHFCGKKVKNKLKRKIAEKNAKNLESVVQFLKLNELDTLEGKILGCIKEIYEWGLIIELPNFLTTSVHMSNISNSYNEQTQKFSRGEIDNIDELSNLFSIGDIVVTKILECTSNEKGQKHIKSSMNPCDVNDIFMNTTLEVGLVLPVSIHSREDHGYLLDLGIKNTRAFIKYQEVKRTLYLGQVLPCLITSVKSASSMSIIEVSLDPEEIAASRLSPKQISAQNLIPGMKVTANVCQSLSNGWKMKLKHTNFKGFVSIEHTCNKSSKKLSTQQTDIECVVLHVTSKLFHVYLSYEMNLLERKTSVNEHAIGNYIQNARIKHIDSTGLYFYADENINGFISLYNGGCKPDLFLIKFKIGEIIKECRIIQYYRIDNVYECSLSKKVLEEPIGSILDVNLGDTVTGIISKITSVGIICLIGYYKLKAFCSEELMDGSKEHFNIGDEIVGKVVQINKDENSMNIALKSIYFEAEFLSSVKNTKPGKLIWGILKEKRNTGVIVEFDNEIKGELSTKYMSYNFKIMFYKYFKPNSVVVCQILKYENGELYLTEPDK